MSDNDDSVVEVRSTKEGKVAKKPNKRCIASDDEHQEAKLNGKKMGALNKIISITPAVDDSEARSSKISKSSVSRKATNISQLDNGKAQSDSKSSERSNLGLVKDKAPTGQQPMRAAAVSASVKLASAFLSDDSIARDVQEADSRPIHVSKAEVTADAPSIHRSSVNHLATSRNKGTETKPVIPKSLKRPSGIDEDIESLNTPTRSKVDAKSHEHVSDQASPTPQVTRSRTKNTATTKSTSEGKSSRKRAFDSDEAEDVVLSRKKPRSDIEKADARSERLDVLRPHTDVSSRLPQRYGHRGRKPKASPGDEVNWDQVPSEELQGPPKTKLDSPVVVAKPSKARKAKEQSEKERKELTDASAVSPRPNNFAESLNFSKKDVKSAMPNLKSKEGAGRLARATRAPLQTISHDSNIAVQQVILFFCRLAHGLKIFSGGRGTQGLIWSFKVFCTDGHKE